MKKTWIILALLGVAVIPKQWLSNVKDVFAETSKTETAVLEAIPGANWNVPLFLTVERNVSLGFFDWLVSGASTLISAGGSVLSTAGTYLGNALSGIGSITTGTVLPAIVNTTGTIAEYLKPSTIINFAGNAWEAAQSLGSKAWDIVAGSAQWITSHPEEIKKAAQAAVAVAGAVYTIKQFDQSTVTNNTQAIPNAPVTQITPKTEKIGNLSSTSFNEALIVRKLYHPQYKDTLVLTDNESIQMAQSVGYSIVDTLGYASPKPFYGCVPIILLYNAQTADHIIITNTGAVGTLERAGYVSRGCIGYCLAP